MQGQLLGLGFRAGGRVWGASRQPDRRLQDPWESENGLPMWGQ